MSSWPAPCGSSTTSPASTRTGAVVALGVAVLAAAGLVVGGNGGDEPPAPADRTAVQSVSPPVDPDQDYTDPTAVCLSFADTVHRHDTRTDTSAQAAYRRAMAYATAELAAAVAAQPEARDHQWHYADLPHDAHGFVHDEVVENRAHRLA